MKRGSEVLDVRQRGVGWEGERRRERGHVHRGTVGRDQRLRKRAIVTKYLRERFDFDDGRSLE